VGGVGIADCNYSGIDKGEHNFSTGMRTNFHPMDEGDHPQNLNCGTWFSKGNLPLG